MLPKDKLEDLRGGEACGMLVADVEAVRFENVGGGGMGVSGENMLEGQDLNNGGEGVQGVAGESGAVGGGVKHLLHRVEGVEKVDGGSRGWVMGSGMVAEGGRNVGDMAQYSTSSAVG